MPSKSDQLTYLLSTRDFWGQYRTQKENAAWAATALYLGGVLVLAMTLLSNMKYIVLPFRVASGIVVILSALLALLFIRKQWIDRVYAWGKLIDCDARLGKLGFVVDEPPADEGNHWNQYAPIGAIILWTIAFVLFVIFLN